MERENDRDKLTECERILLNNTDWSKAWCRNIDGDKVDWNILRHVNCHRSLGDGHVDLVYTWRPRVVVVVVVVLVVVVVRKLNLQ